MIQHNDFLTSIREGKDEENLAGEDDDDDGNVMQNLFCHC